MIEKIRGLVDQIATLDGVRVELSAFPSGAATLHVVRNRRLFVLDFSPTRGFGVDEVHEDDGFLISFRFTSDEFEPAAAELRSIVGAVASTVPAMDSATSGTAMPAEVQR